MSTVARPTSRRGATAPKAPAPAASTETPPAAESGQADGGGAEDEDELEPEPEQEPAKEAPPAAAAARATTATDHAAIAKKERERVLAIQKLGRPGEEKIVAACIDDPTCTPEAAAFKLRNAEAAGPAGYLAALAGDEQEAPAPAASGAASEELSKLDAVAESIVNAGKTPATTSAKR